MDTPTLAEVIGQNVRRIRQLHNLTLEAVAAATVKRGLRWTNTRVASMEAGSIPPNLNTVIPLALALSDCTGQPLELKTLFESEKPVQINKELELPPGALLRWVSGSNVDLPIPQKSESSRFPRGFRDVATPGDIELIDRYESVNRQAVRRAFDERGVTEQRVCASLGISPLSLAIISVELWGCSFSAERDRRASDASSPQSRGRVSRELKNELQAELSNGNSQ